MSRCDCKKESYFNFEDRNDLMGKNTMINKYIPFSRGEYERRLGLVRQAMDSAGMDTLFVTDPSNMAWLTGYDGWSFYVHQGVIVFLDRDPVWWGRRQDANGALRTVWMDDDRIHGYDDGYVQSSERHPMQDLAMRLNDHGAGRAASTRRIRPMSSSVSTSWHHA